MLNIRDYFGKHKPSDEELKQAQILIAKVSNILSLFGEDRAQTSGFRSPTYNKQIGGSPNSAHCFAKAIDVVDKDGSLGKWLLQNEHHIIDLDLYAEHPDYTKGWCHLTTRAPKSGLRFFKP